MPNSVGPDQLASSYDLDLHCLQNQDISGCSRSRVISLCIVYLDVPTKYIRVFIVSVYSRINIFQIYLLSFSIFGSIVNNQAIVYKRQNFHKEVFLFAFRSTSCTIECTVNNLYTDTRFNKNP